MKNVFATMLGALILIVSVTSNAISLDQLEQESKIATFLEQHLICSLVENDTNLGGYRLERQISLRIGGKNSYQIVSVNRADLDFEVVTFEKIEKSVKFVITANSTQFGTQKISCEIIQ